MFTTREILSSVAVPAGVALLVFLAAWRPWKRGEGRALRGHWDGALAAGIAFLVAYALLDWEVPAWPPTQSRHWLFFLAAGLMLVGLLDAAADRFFHVPDWMRAEVALVASAAIVLLILANLVRGDTWPALVAAQWVVGMTVVLHVAWVSAEMLVTRLPRCAGPAVVFVFAAGAALVLMLSGSLVYGRLAGVLTVVAAVAVLVSIASPGFSLARGGVTVIVPLVIAILFLGYHLVEPGVGAVNGGLLLGALLLPWLAKVPPLERRPAWVRGAVAVMLALLMVGVAAYRARAAFLRAEQEDTTGLGELYTLRTQH
jgi:hypothetical protein